MMDYFISLQNPYYPPFQEQINLFRSDLGLDPYTSLQDVFEAVCGLPGFRTKGTLPKLSRWFSWNQSYEEQAREFRAFRMIVKHWLGDEATKLDETFNKRELQNLKGQSKAHASRKSAGTKESLRSEFSRMKEQLGGGMKLAYFIMTDKLLHTCHMIAAATRPTWSWYSATVKNVENAQQTISQTIGYQKSWASDSQLLGTAAVLTDKLEEVTRLFSDPELSKFHDTGPKLFKLVSQILRHRSWSLAKQYSAPPDCYAAILGDCETESQARSITALTEPLRATELESEGRLNFEAEL